ncbi:hypothetical protein SALBM135S_09206 [Streptomyces alboniger]
MREPWAVVAVAVTADLLCVESVLLGLFVGRRQSNDQAQVAPWGNGDYVRGALLTSPGKSRRAVFSRLRRADAPAAREGRALTACLRTAC